MATRSAGTRASKRPRCSHVDAEGIQIPAVHADDAGARLERAVELGRRVDLDQCVEPRLSRGSQQRGETLRCQRPHDEQHGGGAGRARLQHLELVENEILPQQRHGDRRRGRSKVVHRPAEVRLVGQHRDRRRAVAGIERRALRGIEVLPDHARRGRPPLHLRDHRDTIAPERASERRRRRARFRPPARARRGALAARPDRGGWSRGSGRAKRPSCPSASLRV